MASQVIYEDFRGTGDLDLTKPATLTGVNNGAFLTWDTMQGGVAAESNRFQRTGSGASVLAPSVGDIRSARLSTHFDVIHSSGVSVFEASVLPGFSFRVEFDFEDRYIHIEVDAAGNGRWIWNNAGSGPNGAFTATGIGALVVLRMEVTNTQTRYYVNDVLRYTHSSGIPYGLNISPFRLTIPRVYAAHGFTPGSTLAALNYMHVKTETVSGPLGGAGGADTTPPTHTGSLTVTFPTPNTFTVTYPAATDDVAVTGYEYSINGGAYVSNGTALSYTSSIFPTGATIAFAVRAFDAAGNRSTPLSTTIFMAIVAIPVGASPPKFPLETRWEAEPFALVGSLTLPETVSAFAVSGDGNTVAFLTHPGTEFVPNYTIRIYVRNGSSFTSVATFPSGLTSVSSGAELMLDWAGRKLVCLHTCRPSAVAANPQDQGLCRTFGLSTAGWVLASEQRLNTFLHGEGAGMSGNGLRLVVLSGWASESVEPQGAQIYAWDNQWVLNESYVHTGELLDTRSATSDSETLIATGTFDGTFKSRIIATEADEFSTPIEIPNYTGTRQLKPFFVGAAFFAAGNTRINASAGVDFIVEYRKTEAGWQPAFFADIDDLVPGRSSALVGVSGFGAELHLVTGLTTWTRFRRSVRVTYFPPGFVPTFAPEEILLPPRPATYSLFWTAFNATYEVP